MKNSIRNTQIMITIGMVISLIVLLVEIISQDNSSKSMFVYFLFFISFLVTKILFSKILDDVEKSLAEQTDTYLEDIRNLKYKNLELTQYKDANLNWETRYQTLEDSIQKVTDEASKTLKEGLEIQQKAKEVLEDYNSLEAKVQKYAKSPKKSGKLFDEIFGTDWQ